MSTAERAFGGSSDGRGYGGNPWGNAPSGRGASRWTAFELVAMVLGFIVFWPIGLAILGYKFYQRKTGAADLQTVATKTWHNARAAMGANGPAAPRPWSRGFTAAYNGTGNHAFDQWKRAEIERLEAERRKLEDAHREFADFLDNVRKSKDREEFERFMNERRNR